MNSKVKRSTLFTQFLKFRKYGKNQTSKLVRTIGAVLVASDLKCVFIKTYCRNIKYYINGKDFKNTNHNVKTASDIHHIHSSS